MGVGWVLALLASAPVSTSTSSASVTSTSAVDQLLRARGVTATIASPRAATVPETRATTATVATIAATGTTSATFGWQSDERPSSGYRLHVAYDPDRRILGGRQRVRWYNRTGRPATEVHMVLRANLEDAPNPNLSSVANAVGYARGFDPAWTKIKAVTDRGDRPLRWRYADGLATFQTYNLDNYFLVVELPKPVPAGEFATFAVDFETKVPWRQGDAGTINGELTWRFGWFPQERRWDVGAGAWDDGDTLEAFRFQLELEVPEGLHIAVGADQYSEQVQGGARIGKARSDFPVRSVPLFLTDSYDVKTEDFGGLEVTVISNPDFALLDTSEGETERMFEWVARILNHFEPRYGPLRGHRLIVAESTTTGLSMAADGMVLLGDAFWIYDRTILGWGFYTPLAEATLAHELAHLWWGVGIGADFTKHNWLSEAFAQYLSISYMNDRERGGRADYFNPNFFLRFLLGAASDQKIPRRQVEQSILPSYHNAVHDGVDGIIAAPVKEQEHAESLTMLWYQKGYLVVKALEGHMPRATVEAVLRRMYREYGGGVATIADLQRVAEAESGVSLSALFDGWVFGDAVADYAVDEIERFELDDGYETKIHLRRLGQPGLPVRVAVYDRRGEATLATWDARAETGSVTVQTEYWPTRVAVDPEYTALDVNRRDNHFPRRTRFSLLMAENDPDAYVLTMKPTRVSSFGVAGPALGGNYLDDHQWWVGGGLGGVVDGGDDAADVATSAADTDDVRIGGAAYVESTVRIDRAHGLYFGGVVTFGTRAEGSVDAAVRVGYQLALFEAPEVGLVAPLHVPSTLVSILAGPRILTDGQRDEPTIAAELALGVTRDDSLKLGLLNALSLRGGVSDDGELYALGRWDLLELWSLGQGGSLEARLAVGYATESTPKELRFSNDLSPAALLHGGDETYNRMAQAGLTWHLPLLQQLRIKNLLTLHLFVLNGIDLDVHYLASYLDRETGALDEDAVIAEAGGGLTFHLALFDGFNIGLRTGWTFPFAPSTLDPAGGRFYLTLGASPFAL